MPASSLPILGSTGTALSDWNWRENFVQMDENLDTGTQFIASESTLIASGPAKSTTAMDVIKIGLCPSIQVQQQIPQQRLYEIGSMRCHILNGIPAGNLSINRLIYNGPSLTRALYADSYDDAGAITKAAMNGQNTLDNPAQNYLSSSWTTLGRSPDKVFDGHKGTKLWLSMWDTRFKLPFGLAIFMQDIKGNAVGGLYFEGCKIGGHQFGQSAGQMILMEGIQIMFDRSVPIVSGPGNNY